LIYFDSSPIGVTAEQHTLAAARDMVAGVAAGENTFGQKYRRLV
jgi:hypothetical protein